MKLIVGLGNPGKEYQNTRHNVGVTALDKILEKYNLNNPKKKLNGLYYQININGENIIFLKPQQYINLSGDVIRKYIEYYKIDVSDMLVIHDDLDIQSGNFKLKESGSTAGHNGLKNIEENLKTKDYKRLKIGISNNKDMDKKDYVLGTIPKEEKIKIDEVIDKVPFIFEDYLNLDFTHLMNKYNKRQ